MKLKHFLKITSSPIAIMSSVAIVASVAFTQAAYAQSSDGTVVEQVEELVQEPAQEVQQQVQEQVQEPVQEEVQQQVQEQAPEPTKAEKKAARKEARQAEKAAAKAEKRAQKQEAQAQEAQPQQEQAQEAEVKQEEAPEQPETAQEEVQQDAPQQAAEEKELTPKEARQAERQERKAERKAERQERRAERQAERKAARSEAEQAAVEEEAKQAEEEAKQPVTVSEDAAKPKDIAPSSAEQLVEEAEKEQVVVVPDEITENQKAALKRAEKKRREEARERRREILGAAAVGAVIGAVIPQLGGRVAADEGDMLIIERDDGYVVQRDDSSLLRGQQSRVTYENMNNGRTREIIRRPNGVTVITVRDPYGSVLRRVKEFPNGDRVVLYDFRDDNRRARIDYDRRLAPIRVDIPRDRYVVSARRADRDLFYDTLIAEPVEVVEEAYTLQDIRENERLRAKVRRVDLDTIQFATGSAFVTESQVRFLGDVAGAMLDVIDNDPGAVFFIEGHTDAVGSDIDNLALSDRRAEAVGRILSEAYDVPPENLVIQGYGEEFLKVDTQGPSAANRRATIRNIAPLLAASR